MIHARPDYNRFQDPLSVTLSDWIEIWHKAQLDWASSPLPRPVEIGVDEPVFLMRARDALFINALSDYAEEAEGEVAPHFIDAIKGHLELAQTWQQWNDTKTPDMPEVAR